LILHVRNEDLIWSDKGGDSSAVALEITRQPIVWARLRSQRQDRAAWVLDDSGAGAPQKAILSARCSGDTGAAYL